MLGGLTPDDDVYLEDLHCTRPESEPRLAGPPESTRLLVQSFRGLPSRERIAELIRDAEGGGELDAGQMVRWAGEAISMQDFLAGGVAVAAVQVPRLTIFDGRSTSCCAVAHGLDSRRLVCFLIDGRSSEVPTQEAPLRPSPALFEVRKSL